LYNLNEICRTDIERGVFDDVEELSFKQIVFIHNKHDVDNGFIQSILKRTKLKKFRFHVKNQWELVKILNWMTQEYCRFYQCNYVAIRGRPDTLLNEKLIKAILQFIKKMKQIHNSFVLEFINPLNKFKWISTLINNLANNMDEVSDVFTSCFQQWVLFIKYEWDFVDVTGFPIYSTQDYKVYDQEGKLIQRNHQKVVSSFSIHGKDNHSLNPSYYRLQLQ